MFSIFLDEDIAKIMSQKCTRMSQKFSKNGKKMLQRFSKQMLQGQTYFLIDYNSKIQVLGFLQNKNIRYKDLKILGFQDSSILQSKDTMIDGL